MTTSLVQDAALGVKVFEDTVLLEFGPEYDRQFTTVCLLPSHARRIAAALVEAANQAEHGRPE